MAEEKLVEVVASPTFNRNIRTLAKKYRSIRNDLQPIIEQLEIGELPGEQIQGTNYTVFKLRVRNSDLLMLNQEKLPVRRDERFDHP